MRTILLKQVVATPDPGQGATWQKWPDTNDTDFSELLAKRWEERYQLDGDTLIVIENRLYPVYMPYVTAGELDVSKLPMAPYWIDNTKPPSDAVLRAMELQLIGMANDGCTSLYWHHTTQCFPAVMERIEHLFKLRVMHFFDDCPGSSEIKTFPVAKYFNALVYGMGIFDAVTGQDTGEMYKALGVEHRYLVPLGSSAGFDEALAGPVYIDRSFDAKDKAADIMAGNAPETDLTFVGAGQWMAGWRGQFMQDLFKFDWGRHGLKTRFHGVKCRDGVIGKDHRDPTAIASLYANTLFGVNPQVSSLYNTRLVDLFKAGVIQLVFDPHGELPKLGLVSGKHYLQFDGTVDGLLSVIAVWRSNHVGMADIIERGPEAAAIVESHTTSNALTQLYGDFREVLA